MNYPETFRAINKEDIGRSSSARYGFLLDKVSEYPQRLWAVRRDCVPARGYNIHRYDERQLDEYFLTIWKYLG